MNKQKGIAPILIVILLALAVGGYLIYTNNRNKTVQSTPVPTSSPTPTSSAETANWKTYTDTKLNFSIKYPEGIAISRTLSEGGVEFSLASELTKDFRERSFSLNIYFRGDKNVTPDEAQKAECPKPCTEVAEKVALNNAQGVKVSSTRSERYYLAITGSKVIGIFLIFPSDTTSKDTQTDLEEFRQILSTFKFTN